ncbi:hypothetical protein CO038_04840 [Candidatus Pacearchaeota archaeon CG_4_9_14_0_2_um_filter_39_13]|nr:hypothetical protein [Candidatus Pacearchaeota archaeon]OIO43849.1 MAG: hypothetical protein AUJ64_01625 [Candidatus Pacearchaeota archaeon CG1_02_39_14]PJC44222.1 MAG: hypothetical protein CO038_04840 [Candidatus Pacearchaeota archaeon CG_4_9_14_0_2_um_filter_39_13]
MKKGQVWVETVVYTLIGLALIGLVLTIMTPKINEFKDKSIIDQTIDTLRVLDSKVSEVIQEGAGNVRNVELGIKRGDIYINFSSDEIYYELQDSRALYSEPGVETSLGRIRVLTTEGTVNHKVRLTLSYESDLESPDGLEFRKYTAAAVPYRFSLSHLGYSQDKREIIEIKELAR